MNERNENQPPQDATKSSLERRLAEARAKIDAAQQRRDKLEADKELEREVEKAEQMAIDTVALANLEAEHGADRLGIVETDMGIIVLKRPDALRYKKFQDLENAKTLDVEKLVRPCVIHPDKARFDLICAELPASLVRCGSKVAELAGVRSKEVAGK